MPNDGCFISFYYTMQLFGHILYYSVTQVMPMQNRAESHKMCITQVYVFLSCLVHCAYNLNVCVANKLMKTIYADIIIT